MQPADPHFPPLLTGHAVAASLQPLSEACNGVRSAMLGAGDVLWARRADRMEFALVLEPDVSAATALQMAPLALVAVAETLGALAPPQVAVEFRWPSLILVNGGVAGAVELALADTAADERPAWLVVGISLALEADARDGAPGRHPDRTTLDQEGGGDITSAAMLEALAPRLLAWLDTWSHGGFRPIHDEWFSRIEGRTDAILADGVRGRVLGLDESAGLILKPQDGPAQVVPYRRHVTLLPAQIEA